MDIRIDDRLWATSLVQKGVLERWRVADGLKVTAGQAIAEVRLEDNLHEITAPCAGRLFHLLDARSMIEPGALIARLAKPDLV
jgi:pyruvate/2-oxoglutarate dehydrogenase complex dihydrolipoamide acyltransferase (E2) component